MDDEPFDDTVFMPNPLLVAEVIFESPKPSKSNSAVVQRRGSEVVMNYTRHPSDAGQQAQVHFPDGKTTRLTPHQPPHPYPQQYPPPHQASYPPQQQQPPYQTQPYFVPPPNQDQGATAPIPIPRPRGDSNSTQSSSLSHGANPSYLPLGAYGGPSAAPTSMPASMPPPAVYGSWPQHGFYPPPGAVSQTDFRRPSGMQGYYPPPPLPSAMKHRTGSSSSYASHRSRSSHQLRNDDSPDKDRSYSESPLYETDEDSTDSDDSSRRHRHRRSHSYHSDRDHHHHHHHRSQDKDSDGKHVRHGDRRDGKYSNSSDHASLADTLVLIWDGLSGGFGKPRRH